MKELNLNFNLVKPNGEEFVLVDSQGAKSNQKASQLLADMLSSTTQHLSCVKAWDFACALAKNGKIFIDDCDLDLLYKEVESNKQVFNLGKAQLLKEIGNCRVQQKDE